MNKLAVNANTLWMYAVLVHIVGSIVVNIMVILPLGSAVFMTTLWVAAFFLADKNRKYIIPMLAGWILSLYVLYNIPSSYAGSFLLNGMMFVLILYVCRLREVNPVEFCHLRRIPIKQLGYIVLITVGLIIISGYINGLSMLVFYNGTANSLQEVGSYFPESLIVFAFVPAISEEFLFRGCLYQEISGTNKKELAVLICAGLFALLHMNFNQMSYAFVMGIFFGWIVCMTDNLSISILIHALFNSFTVLSFAFPNNFLIKRMMNIHVGIYYIFNPILKNENGMIMGDAVLAGAILFLCMLILVGGLLYLLKKDIPKQETKKLTEYENIIKWKPDREFWSGCLGCIIFAMIYELFMMK